jgi:hypothetical protein
MKVSVRHAPIFVQVGRQRKHRRAYKLVVCGKNAAFPCHVAMLDSFRKARRFDPHARSRQVLQVFRRDRSRAKPSLRLCNNKSFG